MGKYVISSGHGLYIRGAAKYLDEVNEARRVVKKVAEYMEELGSTVYQFHDNTSKNQKDNINAIVKYHNSKSRDLDISVHFNANSPTNDPRGTEVLYLTEKALSAKVSKAIAEAGGLKDRGAKYRDNLGFLKGTVKPAILIEVCFVDSAKDKELYEANFDKICKAIAESIVGKKLPSAKTEQATSTETNGKVYRLFTGTFKTKASAEAAADKITKATGLQIKIREE
jgi:N-acetylmuramoyl-L-alanine amidase